MDFHAAGTFKVHNPISPLLFLANISGLTLAPIRIYLKAVPPFIYPRTLAFLKQLRHFKPFLNPPNLPFFLITPLPSLSLSVRTNPITGIIPLLAVNFLKVPLRCHTGEITTPLTTLDPGIKPT